MDCLTNIVKKMQDKSPLKYTIVRQMACLDPTSMFSDPDLCYERMKGVVQRFLHDNQLSGGASAGTYDLSQNVHFFVVCLSKLFHCIDLKYLYIIFC